MYEFTDKEIRAKFKETEYGQKTNKYLKISLVIFVIVAILIPLIFGVFFGMQGYDSDKLMEEFNKISSFYLLLVEFSLIFVLYFDGKRDGAIEQFKKNMK